MSHIIKPSSVEVAGEKKRFFCTYSSGQNKVSVTCSFTEAVKCDN